MRVLMIVLLLIIMCAKYTYAQNNSIYKSENGTVVNKTNTEVAEMLNRKAGPTGPDPSNKTYIRKSKSERRAEKEEWKNTQRKADDAFETSRKADEAYHLKCAPRIGSLTNEKGDRYEGTIQYRGYIFLDQPYKDGTITYVNGDRFVGNFDGDWSRNGYGEMTWANGERYEGLWSNDKKHGKGKLYAIDGTIAKDGTWDDDYFLGAERNGHFIETNGDDTYDGEWKDGKKNGHGIEKSWNGDIYDGQWKGGKKNGAGILTSTDDIIKEIGVWVDGELRGHVVIMWKTGARYEGDWRGDTYTKNGFMWGEGTYTWPERTRTLLISAHRYERGNKIDLMIGATKYIGGFSFGHLEGYGTLYDAKGNQIQAGYWHEDSYIRSYRKWKKLK